MQNPNVKYLKTPQGDIAVFSLEHNRLWCRRQTSDGRYTPSYYKVVVFIDSLQGLYAILLEILWIVYHPLPLDGL